MEQSVKNDSRDKDWAAWVSAVWIASHATFFVLYAVVTGFDRYASLQPMPMGHKICFFCAGVFALVVATKAKQDTERRKRRRTRLIDFGVIWTIFSFLGLILAQDRVGCIELPGFPPARE